MGKKRLRIGFITDVVASEYSSSITEGIIQYCIENDIELILFSVGGLKFKENNFFHTQFFTIFSFVSKNNLDGVVICSNTLMHSISKEEYLEYLNDLGVPVVSASVALEGYPSVVLDCTKAYDSLLQYLIDNQGSKKFALMGVKSLSDEVTTRTSIFKNVLVRNRISLDDTVFFESDFTYADAYKILYEYNQTHTIDFDTIVALNDEMAFACIDFLKKYLHKKIPQEIIVTGFDNFARVNLYTPTLTSVDQQITKIGATSAKLLHQTLLGKNKKDLEIIDAAVFLRNSTKRKKYDKSLIESNYHSINIDDAKSNNSDLVTVSYWYEKRRQILQAANFYTTQNRNIDLYSVGNIITEHLQKFGLQGAAVVVYETPINNEHLFKKFKLPNKAVLLSGFDYEAGFNTCNCKELVRFDPSKTILPDYCMKFSPVGIIAFSLYHDTQQLGYILIKKGDYDIAVYELLKNSIASQIKFSFDCTEIEKEHTKILNQNVALDIIAQTDEMTSLKNRRGFFEFGRPLLAFAQEKAQSGFLLFCDMDGLKTINDTYGHKAGDEAIIGQAMVLNKTFRSADILARLGGDEFAIICPQIEERLIKEKIKHIESECKNWGKNQKKPFNISISIGYIKYPLEDGNYNINTLLSEADKKLYQVKKAKKAKS